MACSPLDLQTALVALGDAFDEVKEMVDEMVAEFYAEPSASVEPAPVEPASIEAPVESVEESPHQH